MMMMTFSSTNHGTDTIVSTTTYTTSFSPLHTNNTIDIDIDVGGTYTGTFARGYKEGSGTMLFQTGSRYDGHWKDNRFHGRGKYNWSDGRMYEGTDGAVNRFILCSQFLHIYEIRFVA